MSLFYTSHVRTLYSLLGLQRHGLGMPCLLFFTGRLQWDALQEEVRGCWHIPPHLAGTHSIQRKIDWSFISIPEHLRGFAKINQRYREEVIPECSSLVEENVSFLRNLEPQFLLFLMLEALFTGFGFFFFWLVP